jgi:membrane protease YdiL (CAAX protease family)
MTALTADRSLERTGDRISWPAILALHLLPGLLATAVVVTVEPLTHGVGVPPGLTLVIGTTLIGGLMQLGYLLLRGWRHNRRLSLAGVVHYRERTPRWEFVALVAAVLVYALAVLILLMPLQQVLAAHLFWWLPAYLQPTWDPLHAGFGKVALLAWAASLFLLDGIVHPIVEEMYFRGHLLPRMLGTMGWPAPVVSAVLFALQHFWQLYNVPRLALIWLVLGPIVVWKRNLKIGMVAHGAGNLVNAAIVLISILGS